MNTHSIGKMLLTLSLVVVIGFIAYSVMNTPDIRSTGEKLGDAIDELPNGVDKAARQLEDRTPAEKLNDVAKDAGDDLKKATNQQ